MLNNEFNCHSDAWIPDITRLGFDFLDYLKKLPGGEHLYFKDDLVRYAKKKGLLVEEYNRAIGKLKAEIFGSNANQYCADHHKIAALYIQAFLTHKPFRQSNIGETETCLPSLATKLPNEHFSIVLLAAILKAFNSKKGIEGQLEMSKEYRGCFTKLLYHYRTGMGRLDPLSLANIIFLVEKRYFISAV